MGISKKLLSQLPSLRLPFSFFLLLLMTNFSFLIVLTNGNPATPLAPLPQLVLKSKGNPFRPSIAVIVGVLTTVFSVTFLLLLYAKHCRRGGGGGRGGYDPPVVSGRKNSGIDRGVIESLPIFRFASLRGQKEGLECAVCLNKFGATEVLRLLPKCKHGFHVECVDTWLDAHSTCPLCRYRVDPEDILLVEDTHNILKPFSSSASSSSSSSSVNHPTLARVSGRHSFAGNSLQVIVETPTADATARRSLDSWHSRKKRNSEIVADVGCCPRKDELLLAAEQRRLEHRIIVSGGTEENEIVIDTATASADGPNHRWSDVQPSDLLFLRSEMILADSRRYSGSRGSRSSFSSSSVGLGGGRNVINARSVSEITGMSRFRSNEDHQLQQQHRQQLQRQRRQEEQRKRRAAGAVSRWMAWISQSQSQQHQPHPTTSSTSLVV